MFWKWKKGEDLHYEDVFRKLQGKKGFSYVYTQEKFDAYKTIPAWQKLEWLEKMNRFFIKFMPETSKKLCEKLRKGEI